jgi:hypothetical protein
MLVRALCGFIDRCQSVSVESAVDSRFCHFHCLCLIYDRICRNPHLPRRLPSGPRRPGPGTPRRSSRSLARSLARSLPPSIPLSVSLSMTVCHEVPGTYEPLPSPPLPPSLPNLVLTLHRRAPRRIPPSFCLSLSRSLFRFRASALLYTPYGLLSRSDQYHPKTLGYCETGVLRGII